MQTNKKIISLLILFPMLSGFLFLLSGCSGSKGPIKIVLPPFGPPKEPQSNAAENRFQKSNLQGPTAVETAIELSKKHAKLSEEMVVLRQQKQDLVTENTLLKDQFTTSKAQLQQTQKELTEANDLLIEMRLELNNWKVNILGFQEEMRKADTTQLEALLKILEALGGEVKTESDLSQNPTSTQMNINAPNQSQTQKIQTLTSGESND